MSAGTNELEQRLRAMLRERADDSTDVSERLYRFAVIDARPLPSARECRLGRGPRLAVAATVVAVLETLAHARAFTADGAIP